MSVPPSLADWVATAAVRTPHAPALILGPGLVVDYATLHQRIEAEIATAEPPLQPGTRWGMVPTADLDGIARLWAWWRAGAVPIVIPPRGGTALSTARPGWEIIDRHVADTGDHTWVATSGSSGVPKPVRLTATNVAAAVAASRRRLGNGAGDRWLLTLPLHHVGGLSVLWRSAEAGGAVVVQAPFRAEAVAALLAGGEATIASLVPTMLARVLDAHPGPYPEVRAVLVGGAPASTGLLRRALGAGLPVLATYGSTETCSQIATVAPGEQPGAMGTVGRPLDGLAVTVDAPPGETGEIVVDGDAVSPGYGMAPARRGPLHTGDLGRFDGGGRLIVVGRAGTMIRTGGEDVAPERVEQALVDGESVRAAAVVGIPDEYWGQLVAAVVVPGDRHDPAGDERRLRATLAPHEVPKRWLVVAALPLLDNGKVDRDRAAALVTS
ncbi:MAG: AMP-binding protein [Acidimicrobiia bacterium]|nr:AMP-binding protein [Acidimicrobiia bacterium]